MGTSVCEYCGEEYTEEDGDCWSCLPLEVEEENYWYSYEDFLGLEEFEDPGGRSALRRATEDNPRIHPCPTCGKPDRLTQKDVNLHYQCDECADKAEGRIGAADY